MVKNDCSFQTVEWLIEQLKEYPKDLPVVFLTKRSGKEKHYLSDYLSEDKTNLIIDIGHSHAD